MLRGFDEVALEPDEVKTVIFNLTRRDVSNWNTAGQNWEVTGEDKTVSVGSSLTQIRLNATLPRLSATV